MTALLRRVAVLIVALAYIAGSAQHAGGSHAMMASHKTAHSTALHAHAGAGQATIYDHAGKREGAMGAGVTTLGCGLACAGVSPVGGAVSSRPAGPATYPGAVGPGLAMPFSGVEPPPPRMPS